MRVAVMVVVSALSLSVSAFAQTGAPDARTLRAGVETGAPDARSVRAGVEDWTEYVNRDDGFRVVFPGSPTVMETTFKSEYGADLPARVYTVTRGAERYLVTVADYSQAPRLLDEKAKTTCPEGATDERACGFNNAGRGYWKEDIGGAVLWGTYAFIKRNATITHLAWAWQDLVEGHELQLTNNADQSRTFAFVTMHQNRLYILDGTVPKGYPPPALFQQSLGFVDKEGRGVRYQTVYSNMHAEFPDAFPGKPQRTVPGGGRGAGAAPAAPQGTGR